MNIPKFFEESLPGWQHFSFTLYQSPTRHPYFVYSLSAIRDYDQKGYTASGYVHPDDDTDILEILVKAFKKKRRRKK